MVALNDSRLTVAIPCFNEAKTIVQVITDFKRVLPQAVICVFDNNSADSSAELARQAGATVYRVKRQGKGFVMQEIFDRVETDILVVVDGDNTYLAEDAPLLLETLAKNDSDMIVGNRLQGAAKNSFKPVNLAGNYIIAAAINWLFGTNYKDILSGYRVFGQRFIKRVALLTSEFETEIELTLRALEEKLDVEEVPVSYRARPAESLSKLRPFRDGFRIMVTAVLILRDAYPLRLYGSLSLICLAAALAAAFLRQATYLLLFAPIGVILLGIGLTLSAVNTRLNEIKQIIRRHK